ncbi:hypothetical protein [Candidatus Avelusimicrobium luingense]|uniref:hypothetical protein n=1 Tax=Candidatus Avelusimicrobium luingense TaxID=3416211 RepID=UPI003D0B58C9
MTQTPFAQQAIAFVCKVFFGTVKIAIVVVVLTVGVLIAGQSAFAPISVRLLTTYGMEYAVSKLKPYRPLFPEPYVIHLETD